MKPIHFTFHARQQIKDRNTTIEEIEITICKGKWFPAGHGRLTTSMSFKFNKEHYGRLYTSKDVVPVFVEESDRIVIITVYTFFSQKR